MVIENEPLPPLKQEIQPIGPGPIAADWCKQLQRQLLAATWAGAHACAAALPAKQLMRIVKEAADILKAEPTLLEIKPAEFGNCPVLVVGDTHGQYHDVLRLFETVGYPSSERIFVFNGDFVDRGAWGVETLALLLAWKVALPRHVYLLRGNHESTYCTKYYGFQGELTAKYGPARQHNGATQPAGADDEHSEPAANGHHEHAQGEEHDPAELEQQQQQQVGEEGHARHEPGASEPHENCSCIPTAAAVAAQQSPVEEQQQQHAPQSPRLQQQQEQQQQEGAHHRDEQQHPNGQQQGQQEGACGAHNLRPKRAAAAKAASVLQQQQQQQQHAGKHLQQHHPGKQDKDDKAAKKDLQDLIKATRRLFALLPLGALVGERTLVLHGGLFRAPPAAGLKGKRRRNAIGGPLSLGSLVDLRAASKGGQDPNGVGASLVACDVLWSDPVMQEGLRENEGRGGVGCVFGPDVTESFLSSHNLRLIIRSHEGPDARLMRTDLGPMDEGYTIDHSVTSGQLVTVFSAPDYPQFQAVDKVEERTRNKAAVVQLTAPGWDTPEFVQFEAALPRPKAVPYYDFMAATELGSSSEDEEEGDEGASRPRPAGDNVDHKGYGSRSSSPPHKLPPLQEGGAAGAAGQGGSGAVPEAASAEAAAPPAAVAEATAADATAPACKKMSGGKAVAAAGGTADACNAAAPPGEPAAAEKAAEQAHLEAAADGGRAAMVASEAAAAEGSKAAGRQQQAVAAATAPHEAAAAEGGKAAGGQQQAVKKTHPVTPEDEPPAKRLRHTRPGDAAAAPRAADGVGGEAGGSGVASVATAGDHRASASPSSPRGLGSSREAHAHGVAHGQGQARSPRGRHSTP